MWYIREQAICDKGYKFIDINEYVISIRLPFKKLLVIFRNRLDKS